MSHPFRQVDRDTLYLLPPSLNDWLPEGHLARFVVEMVEQLDLTSIKAAYAGRGSKAHHPEMLLALLFYGYATGVFSSRKLERGTYDSIAFRYLAANEHPDHDTIATFRKRFLVELKPLFVQILLIAQQMGVFKLGTVSLDGTKIHANASKHRALSWHHACKLEQQLQAEVETLLRQAEAADQADLPDGLDIPEELAHREERLAAIARAKAEIAHRAAARQAEEHAHYEARLAERHAKEQQTGKKARGTPPKPPELGPRDKDQVNLTDEASRIMPTSGGGFAQCYNAQASVDVDTMLIVGRHLSQHPNDKLEIQPALEAVCTLPEVLGKVARLLADAGYYSATNVGRCLEHEIQPSISSQRNPHHQSLTERFAEPEPLPDHADAVTEMKHRLKTQAGRALYGKRKSTVEPVFGIIKAVMGFRQFLLRGVEAVCGEWDLVCMAWNLKRLHALGA
jgi:transposase/transposase InsO family protein